jgi:hypothetical protein
VTSEPVEPLPMATPNRLTDYHEPKRLTSMQLGGNHGNPVMVRFYYRIFRILLAISRSCQYLDNDGHMLYKSTMTLTGNLSVNLTGKS